MPRDKVIEFQIANAKSLSTENLPSVPGFIGAQNFKLFVIYRRHQHFYNKLSLKKLHKDSTQTN